MFDLGWSELLVIGIVALIVVGPKDLPVMFRKLGEFTGKARRMAREFQSAMNDAAKDSGMDDVAGDLRKIADPKKFGIDAVKDATKDLTAWRPEDAAKGGGAKAAAGAGAAAAAMGPNTAALAKERADARARILEATSKKAPAHDGAATPDPAAPEPAAAAAEDPPHRADAG